MHSSCYEEHIIAKLTVDTDTKEKCYSKICAIVPPRPPTPVSPLFLNQLLPVLRNHQLRAVVVPHGMFPEWQVAWLQGGERNVQGQAACPAGGTVTSTTGALAWRAAR